MVAHKPASETLTMPENNQSIEDYARIPLKDIQWVIQQSPPVQTLFYECWFADRFGSKPQVLDSIVPYSSFNKAKKILHDAGLFLFTRGSSSTDTRKTVILVQNLHGANCNKLKSCRDGNRGDSYSQGNNNHAYSYSESNNNRDDSYSHRATVTLRATSQNGKSQSEQDFDQTQIILDNSNNSLEQRELLESSSSPPAPPATRGAVEEETKEENQEEETAIPEEVIARVQEEMLLHEQEGILTDAQIEEAYFEMREKKQEPSWSIKYALLYKSTKLNHANDLRNIARINGWQLPSAPPIPEFDRSFLTARNQWNKKSRDDEMIRESLLSPF